MALIKNGVKKKGIPMGTPFDVNDVRRWGSRT